MHHINLAILGAGAIADHMADAVSRTPEITGYAIASRDIRKSQEMAAQHGFMKAFGSYEDMLADENIDLVYIAVPHALHSRYALMCLEAGKNVVLEKPFAANLSQANEVISLAKEKKLMAAEGLWMRYLPVIPQLKELCESGIIGEIKMVTGEIGYHLTQPRLFDPAMAGGALLDTGVYALALAGVVLGYDVKEVVSNASMTPDGVDALNSFILKYQDGAIASFNTSMTYMSSCRGTIWGSKGYADIDDINSLDNIRFYDNNRSEIAYLCGHGPEITNCYVLELRSLAKALAEGRLDTPEAPHEDILRRLSLLDRIRGQWNMVYPFESQS